ncbi:CDF family Co(II)/Ni(II) efflux transporter DmeF [Ramlibacter sp. H39-3-26]|uniref:CDF family Co(II)/Ni(II) efflux transporter DmeF n=1 Tax=Curvibacter soli TaxID=3031331 RepID=UPI0023DBB4CE|nr:CDF family Co(II)/Ni(II) efflux transporter DmeF [Ramlibacter sp. H39-3-26]MDF1485086.1 CDF family Co(II)/Ni(II) efflux transporter DmeF [Ramlibacter sp. H39-3-26]
MHTDNLSSWTHEHVFDTGSAAAERGTRWVLAITLAMMAVEIGAGGWFNSMALLADGWHMSSHAVAIGVSAFAYAAARRYARDRRFAFGTWKIEILGGFASALALLFVAAWMVAGSVQRLFAPQPIHYREAVVVAVLGLLVNVACAAILARAHDHGHDHGHAHHHAHAGDHHRHDDLNLRSAYLHVLADAATSVLAITALLGGWHFGWVWLDPAMGIVGAVLVALWSRGLLAETGRVLLDREMDHPVVQEIREAVEQHGAAGQARVSDLHVWRVGRQSFACAIGIVTHDRALTPQQVRGWLAVHEEIAHATVEIVFCDGDGAVAAASARG